MRPHNLSFMLACYLSCLMPRPTQRPSEWCCEFLEFDEASNHGPFRLDGSEYWTEVLDDWGNPTVTDEVLVAGSQSRKTGTLMGGFCWKTKNDPGGVLWVMPNRDLARKFSTQRLSKMIRKSKGTASMVPSGAHRHDMSALSMMLGASTLNLIGSNSAANLSSNPCRTVIMDEVDKFDSGGGGEADAVNLAEQRTKDQVNPQRWKTSTPTLESGLIWQEFLKGDQRRYFVPCPSCSKEVVFAWSKQYTVFPLQGYEAFVTWDADAKVDGKWDYARVKSSAHAVCPHCQAKILDGQKKKMVRDGRWIATNPSAPKHFVSRHLPSLYCSSTETSFGALAVKFIQATKSASGVQGFVNGDLAEPFMFQGISSNRVGLAARHIEVTGEWLNILSVDYHQNAPFFWAVVRAWNGSNKSHGLIYKPFNQWSGIDDLQRQWKVIKEAVIIDVGFNQEEVLQNCANYNMPTRCVLGESIQGQLPECEGWTPAKSFGGKGLFRDESTGLFLPYRLKKDQDPCSGTELKNQMRIELLEFRSDLFEDMLENIRSNRTGLEWTISPEMDTDEYHRHMAGKERRFPKNNPRIYKWETIQSGFPDHIRSCELMNLVHAFRLQLLSFDAIQTKEEKEAA